jgi:hypothetical protein
MLDEYTVILRSFDCGDCSRDDFWRNSLHRLVPHVEQILWRASSIAIISVPVLWGTQPHHPRFFLWLPANKPTHNFSTRSPKSSHSLQRRHDHLQRFFERGLSLRRLHGEKMFTGPGGKEKVFGGPLFLTSESGIFLRSIGKRAKTSPKRKKNMLASTR